MKKLVSILLIIAMVLSFAACGSKSKPEATVKDFCDAMKSLNFKKMAACMGEDASSLVDLVDLSNSEDLPKEFINYFKDCAKKINYKIGSVKADGDRAYVTVAFDYQDVSSIIKDALGAYLLKAISMAFSGASDKEIEKALGDCLKDSIKNGKAEKASEQVEFELTQKDNSWIITDASEELLTVLSSNMLGALMSFGDSLF